MFSNNMNDNVTLAAQVATIVGENVRKRYDELARRPDWQQMWRETGDAECCKWFISFRIGNVTAEMDRKRFVSLMGKILRNGLTTGL